jgi:acetoacetyl-CoA synthetase
MCTALPVYRGELQCRMLGMAVEAFSVTGSLVKPGERGELVCLKPFPCQPVGFWPLPEFGDKLAVEAANARHHESYFSQFKGVWCKLPQHNRCLEHANGPSDHGDHVVITPSRSGNGGGLIMLGRSDGVLSVPAF